LLVVAADFYTVFGETESSRALSALWRTGKKKRRIGLYLG
jgi:hypothetical protein